MIRGVERKSDRPSATSASSDGDSPASGMRNVIRDLLELGELQTILLRIDAETATRRMSRTLVLAISGACLGLAAAPVALLALADWLHDTMGWGIAACRLNAAGTGVVVAFVALVSARRGFRASVQSFDRSTAELSRNIDWLKRSLRERAR